MVLDVNKERGKRESKNETEGKEKEKKIYKRTEDSKSTSSKMVQDARKKDLDVKIEGKKKETKNEKEGGKIEKKKEKKKESKEKDTQDVEDTPEYWKRKFLAVTRNESFQDNKAKNSLGVLKSMSVKGTQGSNTHQDSEGARDTGHSMDSDVDDKNGCDYNGDNNPFADLEVEENPEIMEGSPMKSGQGRGRDSGSSTSDSDSDDEDLEPTLSKKAKAIPPGKGGDSLALFYYADKLWEPHTIVKRSPTGLAAASKNKAIGYPRMTPQKVKQCEEFLKKRAEGENASREEVELRVSRTRYILGQRIASTRKSFRRQKISFPTAEEAQEERKREKRERKQAKKDKKNEKRSP